MRDFFNLNSPLRFVFPIDGDCLNERDGSVQNGVLTATVRIAAPIGHPITVNGTSALEKDGAYVADVVLSEGKNTLTAIDATDGTEETVSAFFLPRSVGKFRISSDDNILFLANITAHKDEYTSIFDDPYLAVYKKAHDLYGAKVHLNLFYAFDREAASYFNGNLPDFDLSMVTDAFKDEWRANADWLKLAFHSRAEWPAAPYKYSDAATVTADFEAVRREIYRFAGEESFSNDVTTVHFGATSDEALLALRELGIKGLAGYFKLNKAGSPSVSYHAPVPLTLHIGERDFWHDTELDITFGRIDLVLNEMPLEKTISELEQILASPTRSGFVSLMIHEQYFYKSYKNHLPDFEARVLEPAKRLFELGYTGAFFKEIIPKTT